MVATTLKSSRFKSKAAAVEAVPHTGLEELLASHIIRQLMDRDGVDPQYVRKLIASIASRPNGIAVSHVASRRNSPISTCDELKEA